MSIRDPLVNNRKITHSGTVVVEDGPPADAAILEGDRFSGSAILGNLRAEGPDGSKVKVQIWVRDNILGQDLEGKGVWSAGEIIEVPVRAEDSGQATGYYANILGQTAGITIIDIPAGCTVKENSACIVNRNLLGV